MTILLPLVALVLAVLAFLLGEPSEAQERPPLTRGIVAVLVSLAAMYAAHRFSEPAQKFAAAEGVAFGAAVVVLAAYLPPRKGAEALFLALGTLATASLLAFQPHDIRIPGIAEIVGFGFAALALADEKASMTAIGGAVVAAATVMGRYGGEQPSYMHAGVAIGIGAALLGVLSQGLAKIDSNQKLWIPVAVRLLGLGMAYAIGKVYLGLHDAWVCMALALAAGTAVWAAVPSDDTLEPGRSALACIIWIGLGTLAFGLARGFGMSLALALAAGIHLVLGEKKALTTCGPLLGLVLYRVFREAHLDASRALDLGQHYALIGFAIGAALPLFPERWWSTKPANDLIQGLGGLLWTAIWAGAPFLAALLLGPKGVVGFVVGAGFSSLFTATAPKPTLLPLAGAAAVGGLSSLAYDWIGDLSDLTRDEKLHWVLIGIIPFFVVGLILALLGFRKDGKLSPAGAL